MQRSSYLPSMDRRTERTQLPLHLRDVYALVTWRTGAIALLISNLIFIMMLEQSTGQNDAVGRVTNGLSTPLSTAAATATSSAAASASPSASALLPSPVTMVVADQAAGAFRRCAANPFIKNWAASDFARAREKLATWAVSSFTVMQPTSQWDLETDINSGREFFAPFVNQVTGCPGSLVRYGKDAQSDGGKKLCDLQLLPKPCVIYSLGSNGNFEFEDAMVASTTCDIFTFDCTSNSWPVKLRTDLSPRIKFVPTCIGPADGTDAEGRPVATLHSLMAQQRHTQIDILKIDVEGHEHAVFAGMVAEWISDPQVSMPSQIAVELHYKKRYYSKAALTLQTFVTLGYVIVAEEPNDTGNCCSEFTLVRAWC